MNGRGRRILRVVTRATHPVQSCRVIVSYCFSAGSPRFRVSCRVEYPATVPSDSSEKIDQSITKVYQVRKSLFRNVFRPRWLRDEEMIACCRHFRFGTSLEPGLLLLGSTALRTRS